jgi:hypothetical protein
MAITRRISILLLSVTNRRDELGLEPLIPGHNVPSSTNYAICADDVPKRFARFSFVQTF